jgi:uncharacterized protein YkwD
MRRLSFAAALLGAVLAVAGGAAAADDPYAAMLAPAGTCGPADEQLNLDQAAAQLVMACLTNYARAQSGLKPLQLNATLSAAGNAKLGADVSCGVFSHEPCGKPFDSVFAAYIQGATSFQIGENIAWGTGSYGTPRQIMLAWLHSTGHRENILTPTFTEIGIGYLPNETFLGYSGAALWSQQFGTRTPASPASTTPASTPKPKKPVVKKKPPPRKKHAKLHTSS